MKEIVLLVPNNKKIDIIKKIRKEEYNKNIKFMSLEEFIQNMTFTYTEEAIYYLKKEYDLNISTAKIYLDNLKYISDKLDNEKMQKLKNIKFFLDSHNLLIYNKKFQEYIKDKKICIYGYDYIDKYSLSVLSNYNYEIINNSTKEYTIDKIYYSNYIDNEVIYVASRIYDLLINNIDINNIKLVYSGEYENVIDRIFKLFNIPLYKKSNIYSINEVKMVLSDLNNNDFITNIKNVDVKKKVIDIINKYAFIDDKNDVKDLITEDLKKSYIVLNNGIKKVSIDDYITDDDFIFLLGFNKENIPLVYKNNDYFSDKEKEILGIDTSNNHNIEERKRILKRIHSIKNLCITYKLYDSSNNYIKSDILDVNEEEINNIKYNYSNMLNKVYLTNMLDNLVKYNIKDNDLDLLSSNYDIEYMNYDNKFTGINKEKLYEYLNNKLLLSYSSLDSYNKCSFKYYLDSILKLNIIKDDFAIIIGNVCHYVLSCMDKDDFGTYKYFDDYLAKQRVFTKKELFFLNKIKEELAFIVNTIRKQYTYGSLDKRLYEEKVFVNKDRNIKVTFMGVIDKVMYKEENDTTYLVIVDYKTGNTDIKLDNMKYGIGLQLPIYLYLSKNMKFKKIEILGFYLQKLLNNSLDNTKDYLSAREDNLKLDGYSIDNPNLLSIFDSTYDNSKLIKSMKTTENGFYSYSKVMDRSKLDKLVTDTDKIIDTTIDNILDGKFDINPKVIDGNNVSCKYCEYKDICFMREKDINYINNKEEEDSDGV